MNIKLFHIHDPMCSWCYAFKPTLDEVRKNLAKNIEFFHIAGGLAKHTKEEMPSLQRREIEAIWKKINKEVGTSFNYDFWRVCTPIRDTYYACKATLLARKENKEDEMIESIQKAYYLEAKNPSLVSTLGQIAKNLGMNKQAFEENLDSKQMQEELKIELNRRRALNVRVFPTLLLQIDDKNYILNSSYNEAFKILDEINSLIKKHT